MADLNKITDFIASCYQDSKFPNDLFMFYENRRDYKDKYRTGVIKYRKNKFFFKILPHDFSASEKKILKNLKLFLTYLLKIMVNISFMFILM